MNGEGAVKLAAKESKREPEEWYSLQNLADSCAQDILQNQDLATLKNVQVNIFVVIAIIKEFYDSMDYTNLIIRIKKLICRFYNL